MKPIEGLDHLAKTAIRPEDLLVFKLVSESFSEHYYIGDHRLISEIVHGHILMGDLIDVKNQVALVINDRRRMSEDLRSLSAEEVNNKLNDTFSRPIERWWKDFSEILKEIDERFDDLLPKLGNVTSTANRVGV